MTDLETLARRLYEQGTRSAPTWEQLGAGTRGEWLKMAQRHAAGDPRWYSVQPQADAPGQSQSELPL
jgi:hypothetical protein